MRDPSELADEAQMTDNEASAAATVIAMMARMSGEPEQMTLGIELEEIVKRAIAAKAKMQEDSARMRVVLDRLTTLMRADS